MEIRIMISDGSAAGVKETPMSIVEGSGGTAAGTSGAAAVSSGGAVPSTQDRAGAINAGPAPAAGTAAGAPQPFVGQRAANVLGNAAGVGSTDESGGSAPGSGAGMEISTQETHHG